MTAAAVFQAHRPHNRISTNIGGGIDLTPRAETWFGYWRDDGYVLRKGKRVERSPGIWETTKAQWLDAYFNGRERAGLSCRVAVSHTDEWIAEAYLTADYSTLTRSDLESEMKKYVLFNLMLDSAGVELDEDD